MSCCNLNIFLVIIIYFVNLNCEYFHAQDESSN
jgi:hypothetical protein